MEENLLIDLSENELAALAQHYHELSMTCLEIAIMKQNGCDKLELN